MTCTIMFALKIDANNHHMQTSKMPKHEILNKCGSQTFRLDCFFFFFFNIFMVFGRNGRRVARKARYIVQFYI